VECCHQQYKWYDLAMLLDYQAGRGALFFLHYEYYLLMRLLVEREWGDRHLTYLV
jgi:hypothetical protein